MAPRWSDSRGKGGVGYDPSVPCHRLTIPLCLGVVGVGCPVDDERTSDTTTGDSTTTTTSSTTTTTSSTTTTATTTGAQSSTSDEGTTGPFELPDCSVHAYAAECDDEPGCVWRLDDGGCVLDCLVIPVQATCDANAYCQWGGDACAYPGPI